MKVTLANMRGLDCRDLLISCSNAARCWHASSINADRWSDDTAFADIEPLFVCTVRRGAPTCGQTSVGTPAG